MQREDGKRHFMEERAQGSGGSSEGRSEAVVGSKGKKQKSGELSNEGLKV